jgi:hypothetical protein
VLPVAKQKDAEGATQLTEKLLATDERAGLNAYVEMGDFLIQIE